MPEPRLIIRKAETPNVFFVAFIYGLFDFVWSKEDLQSIHEWTGKLLAGTEKEYIAPQLKQRIYTEED